MNQKKNNISVEEIRKLPDDQILDLLRKYPYGSQWEDKKALSTAEYCLCLIQGKNYMRTKDKKSFSATNYR